MYACACLCSIICAFSFVIVFVLIEFVDVQGIPLISMLTEMVQAFFCLSAVLLLETPVHNSNHNKDNSKPNSNSKSQIKMRYNKYSNTTQMLIASIFPILEKKLDNDK